MGGMRLMRAACEEELRALSGDSDGNAVSSTAPSKVRGGHSRKS